MVMPTDRIQQMLARGQNPTDVGVGPQVQPGSGGIFSRIDQTLMRPGGSFLLNLLAQEGRQVLAPGQAAFIPGPLGSVARAAQATQQQGQQQEAFDLRRRMLESQIGLNQAQALGALQPGGNAEPRTALAKARADLQQGLITREEFEAQQREVLQTDLNNRADRAAALRGEFRTDTAPIRTALQQLSTARDLGDVDNATAQLAQFITTIRSIDDSVVREGELATFKSIQDLSTKLDEQRRKLTTGGFSDTLRDDIQDTITAMAEGFEEILEGQREFYRKEAEFAGVRPERVADIPVAEVDEQPPPLSGRDEPPPAQTEQEREEEAQRLQNRLDEINRELEALSGNQ